MEEKSATRPRRRSGAALAVVAVVIVAAVAGTAALFLVALSMLLRSRRRSVITGSEALIGAEGEAVSWQGDEGRVRLKGEIWRARAREPVQSGPPVKIVGRDGLVLIVKPL